MREDKFKEAVIKTHEYITDDVAREKTLKINDYLEKARQAKESKEWDEARQYIEQLKELLPEHSHLLEKLQLVFDTFQNIEYLSQQAERNELKVQEDHDVRKIIKEFIKMFPDDQKRILHEAFTLNQG